MTPRRGPVALPLVVLVLGVSACSESDVSGQSDAVATLEGASPAASVSPSRGNPAESSQEFVRRVVAELSRTLLTGEAAGLEALSDPSCTACAEAVKDGEYFKDVISQGIAIEGDPIEVRSVVIRRESGSGESATYRSTAAAHVPKRTYTSESEGKRIVAAEDVEMSFIIRSSRGRWKLVDMGS